MIEDQKAIARLPLIGAGGDARCQYLQIADQRLAAERALHDAAMNAMLVEVEQHQAATEELGDQGFLRRILKQVAAILEHELIGIRTEQGDDGHAERIAFRSEERRVGKEGVRTIKSRWSAAHSKKKK